ncbi:MAG: HEAT repeat domain-containing protein [Elusimicrobia bacterium]|nr:HEAT repeat domain-containing protein [Candidatus Liberimonas magnetica]
MTVMIVISTILFVLFLLTLTILLKTWNRLNNLRNKIKQIDEDRNMLLTKLLQEQEESNKEKIALIAKNIYENNPGEALNYLETMVFNSNQTIRKNVIYALVQILSKETVDMLLKLFNDPDPLVKAEVLKHLKDLDSKIDSKVIPVDQSLGYKIKYILAQEKLKKEWIF